MLTLFFDEPSWVEYRTTAGSEWVPALALGVRRDVDRYEVLVAMEDDASEDEQVWVPRAQVRSAARSS